MTEANKAIDLLVVGQDEKSQGLTEISRAPTLIELGIKTPLELYHLAESKPGFFVSGLGDLPETRPLAEPTFAHKTVENIPSAETISILGQLEMEYGDSSSIASRIGHGPALYFLDCITPGRSFYYDEQTGAKVPREGTVFKHTIEEYVDYRRRRIRAEISKMYPTLSEDFYAWSQNAADLNYQEQLAYIENDRSMHLQGMASLKRDSVDQASGDYGAFSGQWIETRYQEALKNARMKRDEEAKFPPTLIYNLERYASHVKENTPGWEQAIEVSRLPARLKCQTLAIIQQALYRVRKSAEPEFSYDINNALDQVRIDQSLPTASQKRNKLFSLLSEHFNTVGLFDKYPEYKTKLATEYAEYIIAKSRIKTDLSYSIYDLEKCIGKCLPPEQLVLEIYDDETRDFILSNPTPPDDDMKDKFMTTLTPTTYGMGPDNALQGNFYDFFKWKYRKDPQKAIDLWEAHLRYEELTSSNNKNQFVGGGNLEINEQSKRKVETLNLQLVEPGLPSPEAIQEVRNRLEIRKVAIEPSLQEEWQLSSSVLTALGYDPKEWYWWAKSMKRIGLGGRAARYRTEMLRNIISPTDFKEGTGSLRDSSLEHRFPSDEEIRGKYELYRANKVGVHRNTGFDAYNSLVLPLRVDAENQLGKYDFNPSEVLNMADQAYQYMKKDYNSGGHPDSQIAALRTSLIGVVAGHHEQWYKHPGQSVSDGEARLDEMDAILFLPSLAAENNYDTGVFLTGMKLILQMDEALRRLYAPVIKKSMSMVVKGNHQLSLVVDSALSGVYDAKNITKPNFVVNVSHHNNKRNQQDEVAVREAIETPEVRPGYGGYNVMAITRRWEKGGNRATEILGFLTQDQYQRALNTVKITNPDIHSDVATFSYNEMLGYKAPCREEFDKAVSRIIGQEIGYIFEEDPSTENPEISKRKFVQQIEIKLLSIDRSDIRGSFNHKIYTNDSETYSNDPKEIDKMLDEAYCVFTTSSNWTDPDITVDRETGLLVSLEKESTELLAPGMSSAIERITAQSPSKAKLIEQLTGQKENTELAPLHSAAQIVEVLIGKKLPKDNLAELVGWFSHIQQVGAKIRGLSPVEKSQMLATLDKPLELKNISKEGLIEEIWIASGYLERESVARNIVDATTSAFRISVHRIMDKLRSHEAANMAGELEDVLEITRDEATTMAIEAVAQSTLDRMASVRDSTDSLFSNSDAENPTKEYRDYLKSVGGHVYSLMQDVAKHTDYHYASTHWLQIMDQIAGEDFMSSEGKINLYCVQASFLLYELIMDTMEPIQNQVWHSPMEVFIALEDEGYDRSPEEMLENLRSHPFDQDDKTKEGYTHYFVCLKMPKKSADDTQYFILADQTVNSVKIFSESALVSVRDESLVIDNNSAREISDKEGIKRPEKKQTRILLAQNQGDQSSSMLGHIMERSNLLEGYSETLEAFHPLSLLKIINSKDRAIVDRTTALQQIIAKHPYFISIEGLNSASAHFDDLTNIQTLSKDIDVPLIGLFAARIQASSVSTIGTMTTTPDLSQIDIRAKTFIELAALLSEREWEMQKSMYEHVAIQEDLKVIKKRRHELELENEQKRKELAQQARTSLTRGLESAHHEALVGILFEQLMIRETEAEIADDPGSPQRLEIAMKQIDRQSIQLNQVQSLQAPMLDSKATIVNHVKTGSIVTTQQPLEIINSQSDEAANLLLSGYSTDDQEKMLRLISAYWRAFVKESRMKDDKFATITWENLNAALFRATKKRNPQFADKYPLGDMKKVLSAPVRPLRELMDAETVNDSFVLLPQEVEIY